MTFYVYILQSQKDGRFYIGQTQDLEKRFMRHNSGYEKYTKRYVPWNLVWFSRCETRKISFGSEKKLKALKSRRALINHILENPVVPGSENLQICDLLDFREST